MLRDRIRKIFKLVTFCLIAASCGAGLFLYQHFKENPEKLELFKRSVQQDFAFSQYWIGRFATNSSDHPCASDKTLAGYRCLFHRTKKELLTRKLSLPGVIFLWSAGAGWILQSPKETKPSLIVDGVPSGDRKWDQLTHWTKTMRREVQRTYSERGLAVTGSLPTPGLLDQLDKKTGSVGSLIKGFDVQKAKENIEKRNLQMKQLEEMMNEQMNSQK